MRLMKRLRVMALAAFTMALMACSPELNWRQTTAPGDGLMAMFPCRPEQRSRPVMLVGQRVQIDMSACAVNGVWYALSWTDVAQPSGVPLALQEIKSQALSNIDAVSAVDVSPAAVSGMTPQPQAVQVVASGRLPDGAAVQLTAMFFAKGLRVYQVSMLGSQLAPEASEFFFTELRFAP